MQVWVTSDTHYGHTNILKHCAATRGPFADIGAHDAELIRRWNNRVAPGDLVYHLGDFALYSNRARVSQILRSLNGSKILIRGNHDERPVRNAPEWDAVHPELWVHTNGWILHLTHKPTQHRSEWEINLHGHCHGERGRAWGGYHVDCGVDAWDLTPVSLDSIVLAHIVHP